MNKDNSLDSVFDSSVVDILKKSNEWWDLKQVPDELVPDTKRFLFNEIISYLDDRRIISIIGPRRSGKSTLMFQIMDYLIKRSKIDPKYILFFSGDDIELKGKEMIDKCMKYYFEDYLKKNYRGGSIVYIFIDEIHKIENWQLWLKKFYDLKYNIKFIVSGSSAAKIKKGQKESLAGRIVEFVLFPMNFLEFLDFNNIKTDVNNIELGDISYESLEDLISFKKSIEIKKFFDEYLLVGGFPEWFETKTIRKWQKKLRGDVIKRVIYDDIATLYEIKKPYELETLLTLLASLQSQAYSFNSISTTLGNINHETAANYVSYLVESFLVFEMRNYAQSVSKQVRKNCKYVIVDSGLRNTLLKVDDLNKITQKERGLLIESAIGQHLFRIAEDKNFHIFYWKDRVECDIVVQSQNILVPIEVKIRRSFSKKDIGGLLKFMDKFKLKKGIVVSKEKIDISKIDGKSIFFIPYWMFLLCIN